MKIQEGITLSRSFDHLDVSETLMMYMLFLNIIRKYFCSIFPFIFHFFILFSDERGNVKRELIIIFEINRTKNELKFGKKLLN